MKIDLVVPYVNNKDILWRRIYKEYCERNGLKSKLIDIDTDRYEDIGLINYQLKLVNKYMPFINKIFLLLMNVEQAPKDLPPNVQIVYHGAFIPQKYLPTFNSTTIEMFLWNIKDLGEYFIYANDDMLPFKPLTENDFFDNGMPRIEWWEEDLREVYNVFRKQCYNSYTHTLIRLNQCVDKYKFLRPAHSMTPMVKSHCKQAYNLLHDLIEKHIRAFRTEYQYNQYIYPVFEKCIYGTSECHIDFLYTQFKDTIDLDHDIVCLNYIPQTKEKEIIEKLEKAICE